MSVYERVLASRLSEKISENPEYAEKIGVSVIMRKTKCVSKTSLRKDLTVSENSQAESKTYIKIKITGGNENGKKNQK